MKLKFYCCCNLQHMILARKTTGQWLPGTFPFKDGLSDTLFFPKVYKWESFQAFVCPGNSVIPHSP